MEREIIKLNNEQWNTIAIEDYLEVDGLDVPIEIKDRKYTGSGRHTEHHNVVFKRLSDGKFFKLNYETSVKDHMGWEECNWGSTEAKEVFPKVIETIIYQ